MTLQIRRVPVHDTGIGREAGYASDVELIAAYQRERLALQPWEREILDALVAAEAVAFVCGKPPTEGATT